MSPLLTVPHQHHRELLKKGTCTREVTQKYQGDNDSEDLSLIQRSPSPTAPNPNDTTPLLPSEPMQRHVEKGEKQGSWPTEESREEVESEFNLYLCVTGGLAIRADVHVVANHLKDTLMKRPPGIT